ncbi:PP2C family protein-serine/threonine phosphatase [Nocardioides pantholopis]|uniref:PP2C family protein-serine/threonine phosphatase n=1 Tax=Nocardioides pantholopis TaxID=2483798 RepID=UPI000F08D2A5|nr:PP2C family protein-serine/threonine phosphatase [Nocardioides pantholopis]
MDATARSERPARPVLPARSRLAGRVRDVVRRSVLQEYGLAAALVGFSGALTLAVALWPATVPVVGLMVPLLVGSLLLGPRQLQWFVVWIVVMVLIATVFQVRITPRVVVTVGIELLMAAIVLLASRRRSRLGVGGAAGEAMFVDLRDRILNQGGIPALPRGWRMESALRSAGGTPFAGDFLVASQPSPDRLDVVVVDVSGKGEQAGTRALMLSGAFGGLIGALPPQSFLPAANEYLLRQDWAEGFATAVHLALDLSDGRFELRTAGHPPAVRRAAGSGRWSVLGSEGPVLGLLPDAEFHAVSGVLEPGDAVMLYTDGMVEEPRRDIELGIDRMLGAAEQLLRGEFAGAADRLVTALGSRDDDRAMVVVTRS